MRFRAIILSLALVATAGCSDVDTSPDQPTGQAAGDAGIEGTGDEDAGDEIAEGDSPGRDDRCDTRFADGLDRFGERGFSGTVTIRVDGDTVCRWADGIADPATGRMNTPDTVFSIGSIAKMFTAATVLALAEDGVLAVDDRLGHWLPELGGPAADITLAQLLAHTSGLGTAHGEDHQPLSEDELVTALDQTRFEPGSDFAYSNTGYSALALVIERASDRPFRDTLVDTVLRPSFTGGQRLGGWWDGEPGPSGERAFGVVAGRPGHPGAFEGPHWALDGNGGLAMSMPDLARWVDDLVAGDIIPAGAVDAMLEPAWDHGDGTGESFGWVVVGQEGARDLMYGVSGGGGQIGHEASTLWIPELDAVVAVAANTAAVAPASIIEGLITALLDDADLEGPPTTAVADTTMLDQANGRYRLEVGGTFVAEPGDGILRIQPLDGEALTRFLPAPSGVDAAAHGDEVEAFLFGRTPAGADEQESFESFLGGPVTEVEQLGTGWIEGELRTYVIVRSATDEQSAWLALEPGGGLAAAEVPGTWPTIEFVPTSPTRFEASDDRTSPVIVDITDPERLVIEDSDGAEAAIPVAGEDDDADEGAEDGDG